MRGPALIAATGDVVQIVTSVIALQTAGHKSQHSCEESPRQRSKRILSHRLFHLGNENGWTRSRVKAIEDERIAHRGIVMGKIVGSPSFRVLCERMGTLTRTTQRACAATLLRPRHVSSHQQGAPAASLPALAKNARTGHPQFNERKTNSKAGPPSITLSALSRDT